MHPKGAKSPESAHPNKTCERHEIMQMKFIKFFNFWLPPIFWASLIFSLSGMPNLNSGLAAFWDVFLRKLAHATEFGILAVLIFRAFRGYNLGFWKSWALGLILAVAYAFLDEFHQLFVFERQGKLFDVFVDGLGVIFIGAIIFLFYLTKKSNGA